jgi:hypothetical protein
MSDLTADSEEGFVDFGFKMEGLGRGTDGGFRFEARAPHKGQPLAFVVTLGTVWKEQKLNATNPHVIYWGEAQLGSVGLESDAFIRTLDELYKTNVGALTMAGNTRFTAASLAGNPRRPERESLKMKLFFETSTDELYAEFYLNFDAEKRRVEFHEKDPGYRRAVVLALAQKAE